MLELALVTALAGATALADLVGSITLIEMMISFLGTVAFVILVGGAILKDLAADAFLMFINGPVVEVLHSGHISLYGASRRPHFRQNGIYSL